MTLTYTSNTSNTFPSGGGWNSTGFNITWVDANGVPLDMSSGSQSNLGGVTPPPCEHRFDSRFLEFENGLIVAECVECGDQLHMEHIPGGVPGARVKDLIHRLKNNDSLQDFPEFKELESMLDEEEHALRHARELLGIARKMLAKKLERM